MADSIPSLRRQLGEAQRRIAELEAKLVSASVQPVKVVEVPIECVKHIHVTDPALEQTIIRLQARIREIEWQSTSQSAS